MSCRVEISNCSLHLLLLCVYGLRPLRKPCCRLEPLSLCQNALRFALRNAPLALAVAICLVIAINVIPFCICKVESTRGVKDIVIYARTIATHVFACPLITGSQFRFVLGLHKEVPGGFSTGSSRAVSIATGAMDPGGVAIDGLSSGVAIATAAERTASLERLVLRYL